jgi:hypothetical protein
MSDEKERFLPVSNRDSGGTKARACETNRCSIEGLYASPNLQARLLSLERILLRVFEAVLGE